MDLKIGDWVYFPWRDPRDIQYIGQIKEFTDQKDRAYIDWVLAADDRESRWPFVGHLRKVPPLILLALEIG